MQASDDLRTLARAHTSCAEKYIKTDAALARALDALAAARERGDPAAITRARLASIDAERVADAAWSNVESARRAYWAARLAAAEKKLAADCIPMLREIAALQRFAGLPAVPPEHLLRHHLIESRPHVEPAGDVSVEPLPSPALDRAEDEIVAAQPPRRLNFDRLGRRLK